MISPTAHHLKYLSQAAVVADVVADKVRGSHAGARSTRSVLAFRFSSALANWPKPKWLAYPRLNGVEIGFSKHRRKAYPGRGVSPLRLRRYSTQSNNPRIGFRISTSRGSGKP